MIADLGHFALVFSLCFALLQTVIPLIGAQTGNAQWMAVARPATQVQFVLVAIAFAALTYAFINDDFSLLYVSNNSNTEMPLVYKISAVWGAHEGSLLLWALILSIWTFAVSIFSRSLPMEYVARVIGVMGFVSCGFLTFMLFTSNPFQEIFPAPYQGRELNPLLQDPGLAIHPPMLYMGYVGFSVAFAFAIAALLGGKLDATWARWSRPWTTIAWVFLTIGIALGSWWAYYELGWGGWWFWDPVENASFMPWLVGTALIHSLSVTEKRGTFKAWTVLLAIFTFSLSLLGTFLVRSGVLTSVHAFATDPERGLFILIFLAIVVGGSLALYAWRGRQIHSSGNFALLSRETLMLSNNVLLVVAASAVLLGTLYPLLLDALTGNKISVGPPYFNVVFMILMTPLVVLIAIGPQVRWKSHDIQSLIKTLRIPAIISVLSFGLALFLLSKDTTGSVLMTAIGVMLSVWILLGLLMSVRDKFRHKPFSLRGLVGLGYGFYGMWLAHLGIAIFIVGVSFVSTYSIEDDMRIVPGQTVNMADYQFRFEGVKHSQGPNYVANRGSVFVYRDNKLVAELYPEKRTYSTQTMPMTEAAIDAGLFRDLYVSLGEPIGDAAEGAWLMRVYYKPFQRWIWLAGIFMALGGIIAASDKRYRRVLQREEKQREADAEDLIRELLGSKATSTNA